MRKRNLGVAALVLAGILLLSALVYASERKASSHMISEFGKYEGYSGAVYDGTQRTSAYLTLSDGTRLAYDLILPTKKGLAATEPLPALFKYTPYGRTWTIFDKNGKFLVSEFADLPTQIMARLRLWAMGNKGRLMDPLWRDRWLGPLVSHGYAVVSVDRPGTGASFSANTPTSMETGAVYENEIINWIAAQPWSNSNVGMYGDSWQAMMQFPAAATGNPHLKAILPAASSMDVYQAVEFPGGVYNKAFAALVSRTVPLLDQLATPVDADTDGSLLAQARQSRMNNPSSWQQALDDADQLPYRDSVMAEGVKPWQAMDLSPFIDRINRGHTAIYLSVGWYDVFTADMFYWYDNLTVPKRLTIRPTDHSTVSTKLADLDYGVEALRWLDYWLKGIDDGIMSEPPIHYYLQSGPNSGMWQASNEWPLASAQLTRYDLAPGRSGTSASVNDGALITRGPASGTGPDTYTVDYTTTTGTRTRWGAVEEAHVYPDLRIHDDKSLTYTTAKLNSAIEITGHPVAHLWLTTGATDLDAFVYLDKVDGNGQSTYVTEGDLRASHRKIGVASFKNLGLPYQTHFQADVQPIPSGEPVELVFSLLPTSYRFDAGSRMRITVAFADAGNFDTPVLSPAPTVKILRDAVHPSYVELPIVQTR